MDEIQKLTAFLDAFNSVSNKITSNICAKNCYEVFEKYLRNIGVPSDLIDNILGEFDSWEEVYEARSRDEYSIPVNAVIGKVKGITNAINHMVKVHIKTIEQRDSIDV